ncbi:SDR family NAD(P)-dependent oxidoreductase, partial [Candidatus Bathyarchaeota archaeon]|nr:SDR family NAD(P)-dependent oxidoreductase [Candidatus Bathyarchaeota archaeon]
MKSDLKIVITGASSGIGRAVALKMAENNTFFLTSRRERELEEAAEEVRKLDGTAYIGVGDIRDPDQVKALSEMAINRMGGVDVLVANAGVGYFGFLEDMTLEEYDSQFETNVRGVFLWIKNLLPHMKTQGHGQIV